MQFCAKIEPNYKLGVYYERISIFFISRRNKKKSHTFLAHTMSKSMLQLFLRHERITGFLVIF